MSKRVMVTGAAGRIGSEVTRELCEQGIDVVGLDIAEAPATPDGADPPPGGQLVRGHLSHHVGSTLDRALLREIVAGCDGVVHLAAIPHPVDWDVVELVTTNSIGTLTVLDAAVEAGCRSMVLASSISVLGMAWAPDLQSPDYLPIDEQHPIRATEPYALSKQIDEASAAMFARRADAAVACLRFPRTLTGAELRDLADQARADERVAAKELWAYLDVRDAALACRLALEAMWTGLLRGQLVANVVAPDSLLGPGFNDAVERFHPATTHLNEATESGPYATDVAERTFGFRARFPLHDNPSLDSDHRHI